MLKHWFSLQGLQTYAEVAEAPIITVIMVLSWKLICALITDGAYTPAATNAAAKAAPEKNSDARCSS